MRGNRLLECQLNGLTESLAETTSKAAFPASNLLRLRRTGWQATSATLRGAHLRHLGYLATSITRDGILANQDCSHRFRLNQRSGNRSREYGPTLRPAASHCVLPDRETRLRSRAKFHHYATRERVHNLSKYSSSLGTPSAPVAGSSEDSG